MGIMYNTYKDEINHKDSFLGPHAHFSMESPNFEHGQSPTIYCNKDGMHKIR